MTRFPSVRSVSPSLPRPLLRSLLPSLALLLVACGGDADPGATGNPGGTPATPMPPTGGAPTYSAVVVRALPHDTSAFTEGLYFHDGQLYESTGLEGKSDVRRVELTTGKVLQRVALPAPYFGEGSVIVGDRMYQLTWKHNRAFTYDARTFALRDTLGYTGEGWGLTYDGESLVMSDGTARLRFLDPKTFAVRRTLDVREGLNPVSQLNELEWVKGEILANVWQTDQIVRIDPKTGAVTGWVDLAGILSPADRHGGEDVLNGIAYDAAADKLYVTGKHWAKLFEVRLERR